MTRNLSRGLAAVALVGACLAPAAAHAQVTFYGTDGAARADFLAAVGAAQTNDLENQTGSTLDFGALGTATLSGSGASLGGSFLSTSGRGTTAAYALTFSTGLTAFGADFFDLGTCCGNSPFPNGTLRLAFYDGATSVGTFSQIFTTSNQAFFGVAGLARFDRVEVFANDGDVVYTDDLVVSASGATSTVPEPGTYALLGSGLLGVAAVARRRQRV